eukprot:3935963-Rhodomonas_salina.2
MSVVVSTKSVRVLCIWSVSVQAAVRRPRRTSATGWSQRFAGVSLSGRSRARPRTPVPVTETLAFGTVHVSWPPRGPRPRS